MNNNGGAINYNEFRERYNSQCQYWRSEPVNDRKVNNPVCIAVLIVFTLVFLGAGGYFISIEHDPIYPPGPYQQPINAESSNLFSDYAPPILACVFGSIVISLVYILLIKLMPAVMVYVMIFVSLGMLALLALIGFVSGNSALGIPMAILFLVYCIVLFCFRERIKMGIVLVKVATTFISQRPIIFLTPVIKLILTVAFAIFWVYTIAIMISRSSDKADFHIDNTTENVFIGIWSLLWLFYTFFFYYMMVFTIAVTCAFWYYGVEGKNSIVQAYKWMCQSALGAMTFGALLIAIITLVRMVVDSKRKRTGNIAVAVCLCLVACCLRQIEALLKILNHNAIICMAVTGEDFIDAAKTAIGIICSDLPLFSISRIITNLLVFWGLILSVGIPTVIGFIWVDSMEDSGDDLAGVIVVIIFATIMISAMIYSILAESVSCVFIFYCFDRRFRELGFQSHNMPPEINQALSNAEHAAKGTYERLEA